MWEIIYYCLFKIWSLNNFEKLWVGSGKKFILRVLRNILEQEHKNMNLSDTFTKSLLSINFKKWRPLKLKKIE